MYQVIYKKPSNLTISIHRCVNRGGNEYYHPFIGDHAVSRMLEKILQEEYNVSCVDGSVIPDAFFDKYVLVEAIAEEGDNGYVTSRFWYSCTEDRRIEFIRPDGTRTKEFELM